ncbi:Sar s 14 allergen (apolipophorin-like protein) [Sarcoptes scabiei]|uniref:Sar s 14 allergen (Apolipophorin-like protein) n=1 Tax=Sarcoptes scabiei TaxID=52283 RepID=A0A132AJ56_SARSC|nr:Sar s 14 allergen (apolipophorin-like protein) [Sarcoptes scabiei]
MRSKLVALLFIACLFQNGQAHHCTVACPRTVPSLVAPKAQTTYVYSVESTSKLLSGDTQSVTYSADAEVSIMSSCEAVLMIKNAKIEGVPNAEALATELSAKPFAFGYFNGRVMGICPNKEDQDWTLNVKKAIVSALQVQFEDDLKRIEEVDVSGKCSTEYRKIKSDDGLMVLEKKKDLNMCDERRMDLRHAPNQFLGQLKELLRHHFHAMDDDLTCRVTLKDQIVTEVDCEEQHSLIASIRMPITYSSMKLKLKESKDGVPSDVGETDSEAKQPYIGFDYQHKHATEAEVVEVLKKLCSDVSENSASIDSSFDFQKLIHKLKYLTDDETANVDEAVKTTICPAAPKRIRELFLDASAYAASDANIRSLVKAHENDELSASRSTSLFSIVALKALPNKKTVDALLPLIASEKTHRPLLLGISVLVRRYCEKTANCATDAGAKEAREAFQARLATAKDDNEKINLLKALENLNVNTDGVESMINKLDEIIKSKDSDVMVRVAALNAMPNDESHNDRFKSLVADETNPNELRVAAFRKMVKNNGMKHVKDLMGVENHCIKNFVLSFVNNLKKSNNNLRRAILTEDIELPQEPENKIGITRNIAREYGPYTFEYDVIYPKDGNVTTMVNARVTRSTKGELKDLVEIQLYQNGLDTEMGNLIDVMEKKSFASMASLVKDIVKMLMQLRKKHEHNGHLKMAMKVNGKNVMFGDVFEDLHALADLVRKRLEKIVNEKKVDRTIGGVMFDSLVVVPLVNGLPLLYKTENNYLLQYNGEVSGEKGKRNVKLNLSLVSGMIGGAKIKVKDEKMAYLYQAKWAYTPHLDFDIERKDNSMLFRLNLKDLDKRTVFQFHHNLREKRSNGEIRDYDSLPHDEPKEKCFTTFSLEYCRKEYYPYKMYYPNVEYFVSKPNKDVNAIELEFKHESDDSKKNRKYTAELREVGPATPKTAKLEIDVAKGEEYKVTMKSPNNEFHTEFTFAADKNHLKMKADFPDRFRADVTGTFEHDKETGVRKNKLNVEYKLGSDDKAHTIEYENEMAFKLKRSSKEKNTNLMYKSKYISSRMPGLNHKTALEFKYRPFKTNDLNLELEFGNDLQHKYQLQRKTDMEVEEMRPFKLKGNSDIKLVATDFDVDYDLKSDFKYESNKGTPMELQYNLKGKDRSKRAAEKNQEEIEGKIDYKNNGSPIDSKMNANLQAWGNQYAYESELKQVEPQRYEGKITMSKNDKKIFITHKDEMAKPTDTFHLKSEAEVTFSDSEDKKNYFVELKKDKDLYSMKSNVKRNNEIFYENNMDLEKNGKMNWYYKRNDRTWNMDLDNAFNPRDGTMKLQVKDRIYDIKLKREPFRYGDLHIEGNENALIKKGDLHMSLVDPLTLNVLTKNDGIVDMTLDLVSPNTKKAALKINSKKYDLDHDGEITVSIFNPRMTWKHHTRKGDMELNIDADITRKGSLITYSRKEPDDSTKVRYSRQGNQVSMEVDSKLIEGHANGTLTDGKIHVKGRESDFEIESTYKVEDGKLMIEPTKTQNGKLEGLLSRKVPSHLVLETPRVKMNMKYDRFAPVKILKLDYDGLNYEKHIDAEYEPSNHYKYFTDGKSKRSGKGYSIKIDGKPKKALKVDVDMPDFKFNVNKPEDSNKAQFSYTFNDYTETEEYEFDPHRAYILNWARAIRQYLQTFIVE